MSDSEKTTGGQPEVGHRRSPRETRREFLNEIAGVALGIAGLGSMVVTYQYLSPNVLFEPPTTFRAGNPDLYPLNSVTFLQDQLVYIVRTDAGFYARICGLYPPGMHHAVEAGRQPDRVSLPREQVQERWHQSCRARAAAPAAFCDNADCGRGVVGGQAGNCAC